MKESLIALYHRLPYPVRSVAASARGYYLNWWRYGPETDDLVERALERESWPADQWASYQSERLAYILHRAATRVPYYRGFWAERGSSPSERPWLDLSNWPILTKDHLRAEPEAFVAEDVSTSRMLRLSTSGTSGKPLTLWRSRDTSRKWYALFEARWRHWYGLTRHDRWAILGGQLVTPVSQKEPPFWVWNQGMNQLYMSTFHLSLESTASYVAALRSHQVKYLFGYASSMNALAQNILDLGLDTPSIAVAISNAEPLLPHHRAAIEEAFGCPTRNTYGMAEIVAGASECDHGELHLWPEAGLVEVVDEHGDPVRPEQTGRLICTGLLNDDMPLIRYEVGDRGALDGEDAPCSCGRRLPRMKTIEGRSNDNLKTRDGRKIFWLNPVFYGLPIREAQIVQESFDHVRVNLVPADGFGADHHRLIRSRLRDRVPEFDVEIDILDEIPRGPNGKFRSVVSKVS